MARDHRWPIVWSFILFDIHLFSVIAVLGLSARDMVYGHYLSYWGLAQSIVVIVATSLHNILITCWRLSPGWTLTWYLFLTIAWAVLAVTFGFTYADPSTGDICPGGTPYEEWGSYFSYNTFSCFDLTIPTVELAMICVASVSSLAVFILTTVVVHRNRRQKKVSRRNLGN